MFEALSVLPAERDPTTFPSPRSVGVPLGLLEVLGLWVTQVENEFTRGVAVVDPDDTPISPEMDGLGDEVPPKWGAIESVAALNMLLEGELNSEEIDGAILREPSWDDEDVSELDLDPLGLELREEVKLEEGDVEVLWVVVRLIKLERVEVEERQRLWDAEVLFERVASLVGTDV